MAAQCSPLFKLYPFTVTDVVVNPVAFSWLHFSKDAEEQGEDDDEATMAVDEEPSATEEKTMTLFERCTDTSCVHPRWSWEFCPFTHPRQIVDPEVPLMLCSRTG